MNRLVDSGTYRAGDTRVRYRKVYMDGDREDTPLIEEVILESEELEIEKRSVEHVFN